uniref:Large ribosomal subunit protein uL22c n=1 Tax=Anacampseros filamentosa TaxID=1038461 RepID=A0A411K227_9CARY|nr:ribosomal protein L22 [Anacampseros filamentosa]
MGIFSKQKKDPEFNDLIRRRGVFACRRYIPMSADKARRVIDQIRGRSYEEALMILQLMPYRACYPIFRLLYTAAANASHNKGSNKENLIIFRVEVGKGNTIKKVKPQARGRSYLIKRPTCHITIVLKDTYLLENLKNNTHTYIKKDKRALSASTLHLRKLDWLTIRLVIKGEMRLALRDTNGIWYDEGGFKETKPRALINN